MKRILNSICVAAMGIALAGCAPEKSGTGSLYTLGTYSDTQKGFGGDVTVTIETDADKITSVTITGDQETPERGGAAMTQLQDSILKAQSDEVDGVSGATITSDAVKKAAANAISEAKGETSSAAIDLSLKDGTYTATASSYAEQYGLATTGSMTMTAQVKDNQIADIQVSDYTDTDIIGGMAFPILAKEVVDSQSLNVDSVSGATVSSGAFFTALKDVLTQAGGDAAVNAFSAKKVEKPAAQETSLDTDVLVIGAGMAGLTAAISAADGGANVLLLEKNKVYSSSTTRSLGYVIAGGTDVQKAQGVEDTPEAFADDIYSLYKDEETLDPDLLRQMAVNSGDTLEWLESDGVEFGEVIHKSEKGERATKRIHTTKGGGYVTSTLVKKAEDLGVNIMMGTPVTSLIQDQDGAVIGAKATNSNGDDITVNAKSTIVCAGSYTNNEELFHKLNPRIDNIGYACGSGEGDAYNWFTEVSADIVEVPYTQFMYYAYGTTFEEFPEVIPNSPDNPAYDVLLVAGNGKRVTAEDNFCFEFTKENWNLGYDEGYAIVDEDWMKQYPVFYKDVMNAKIPGTDKMYGYEGDTAADLAAAVGLDADALQQTIDRYNELCAMGSDDDFGKDSKYMNKLEGKLYIVRLPQITTDGYTGARINEHAQVLNVDGSVIPGLFAAGSCADGQVTSVNYYGCGTSLLTCATFGREAGRYAAQLLKSE